MYGEASPKDVIQAGARERVGFAYRCSRSSLRMLWFSCLAFLFLAALPRSATSQQRCDPSVPRDDADPDSYRERDRDRCEGYFMQPVSSPVIDLTLVGFTASTKYDSHSAAPVQLLWTPPPGSAQIAIHARSINPRVLFRMDTYKPAQSSPYHWPTTFVAQHNIPAGDIRIFATTQAPGFTRRIVIPLVVGQRNTTVTPTHYCVDVVTPYPMDGLRAVLEYRDPATNTWVQRGGWPVTGELGSEAQNCFPIAWIPSGHFGRVTYHVTYVDVGGSAPKGSPLSILYYRP